MCNGPHSEKRTSQDLATSPLIFPENGLAVVYSRHFRLRNYRASRWVYAAGVQDAKKETRDMRRS